MVAHRFTCPLWVARRQSLHYFSMLRENCGPGIGIVKMDGKLSSPRPVGLFKQSCQQSQEHLIVEFGCDKMVELSVSGQTTLRSRFILHRQKDLFEGINILLLHI